MNRILGFAPVFVSLFWVIFIVAAESAYCRPPHADEDAAAHLFQLSMAAQIPAIAGFLATRGSQPFRRLLPMLGLQVSAWAAAAIAAARMT